MANIIGNYTLKVTPERLQSQATKLNSKINTVRTIFSEIQEKIEASSHYWQGEAADQYRSDYKNDSADVDEMLKRLREHVTDLNSMASVYTGVENELKDIIDINLSADVII